MSRTQRGTKPPAFEYWSRRPFSGHKGTPYKVFARRVERAQGRMLAKHEATGPEDLALDRLTQDVLRMSAEDWEIAGDPA